MGVLRRIGQKSLSPVSEFPLTLGRDCSGVVIDVGPNVTNLKPGDEVKYFLIIFIDANFYFFRSGAQFRLINKEQLDNT